MHTDVRSGHLSHLLLEEEAAGSAMDVESGELRCSGSCLTSWATLGRHLKLPIPVSQFLLLYVETNILRAMDFSLSSVYCHLMLGQRMKKVKQVAYCVSEVSFVGGLSPQKNQKPSPGKGLDLD